MIPHRLFGSKLLTWMIGLVGLLTLGDALFIGYGMLSDVGDGED
jgi:hypothetical protein